MKRGIIVTIDGPAGSGKGTVAKAVSERLSLKYLDTGAMYRAFALLTHREGVKLSDEAELNALLSEVEITFSREGSVDRVHLNGEDVTGEIRTPQISRLASDVATIKAVRLNLKRLQREIGKMGDLVAEGRDMGTYVFPDADFKFYLDAAISERARRRFAELLENGVNTAIEEVEREILVRDRQDRERAESPLHPAPNAVIIDTTNLRVDKVVEQAVKIIRRGLEEL